MSRVSACWPKALAHDGHIGGAIQKLPQADGGRIDASENRKDLVKNRL